MKKKVRRTALFLSLLLAVMIGLTCYPGIRSYASETAPAAQTAQSAEAASADDGTGSRALAAGIVVGIAAGAAAIGMGISIAKSNESLARQPEAAGSIRTQLMLGLVFIETVVIYALIVAILIIFVM